jgi:5-methylcytosine-specific restriction enzyme B
MTLTPGDQIVANRGISEILAVGTVTDSGYEYRADREEYRHTVGVDWDTLQARTIEPIGAWRTTTISKISPAQFGRIFSETLSPTDSSVPPIVIDGLMLDIERALNSRGQVILYGPPGTGKTFLAKRAAVWFAEGGSSSTDAARLLGDENALQNREKEISVPSLQAPKVWFMVANPANWSWDQLFDDGAVEYSYGRLQRNFAEAAVGDLVVCYEASPVRQIVGLARVTGTFDHSVEPDRGLALEPVTRINNGPDFTSLREHPVLGLSEPLRNQCQGTLFSLTKTETDILFKILIRVDPDATWYLTAPAAQLTRVTFHPSYTYEDFIEGFRPERNHNGGLNLQLTDGLFKRVCAAAEAEPERPFVVLIDEINRGNIAKIFGELITLIEHDKRGMNHLLAQSGENFNVPPNVFIIGTMNTADRSIQLLDTALRRRFRFIELMPDTELLEGTVIGGLLVADFLDELNGRIRAKVGRERQVGHAVFFQDGSVITSPDAFAATFRHEVLPLVQEYLYDNYADLADVFGPRIIDAANERVTNELDDALALCAALGEHFDAVGT